jgi:hypothetical protein
MTSGDLKLIVLGSGFIEALFDDPDLTSVATDKVSTEMVQYGKLRPSSGDLAPDEGS